MPNDKLTMPPQVSVVIVNYNVGKWLLDSVASSLKQAAEVIVVDNASSDDSLSYIENEFSTNSCMTILRASQNDGFAKACNKGARIAKTPYILFLNPDCVLKEGAIAELIKFLDGNPTSEMVGGVLISEAGIELRGGRRKIPTLRQAFLYMTGLSKFFGDFNHHQQALPSEPIEVEAISGAMMMLRRETFISMNGFDENYFLHCEDMDLCMRLRLLNKKIYFVPKAEAMHAQGVCSRSRPLFVLWNKHKGMAYFYQKFHKASRSPLLFWFVIAGVWAGFMLNAGKQIVSSRIYKLFKLNMSRELL